MEVALEEDQVEIRISPTGVISVNGLPVHARVAGESAWSAAIKRVARIASRHEGGSIAAVVTEPSGSRRRIRVDAAGTACEIPDEKQEASDPKSSRAAAESPLLDPPAGQEFAVNSDTPWKPQTGPRLTRAEKRHQGKSRKQRRGSKKNFVIGVAALTMGASALVVALAIQRDPDPGHQATSGSELTAAPVGYAPRPLWTTPPLNRGIRTALVPNGIAYVTATNELVIADRATGAEKWRAPFTDGDVKQQLASLTVDGKPSVVVLAGGTLRWWDVVSGNEKNLVLPAKSAFVPSGNGLVLHLGEGEAGTIVDGKLVSVPLPKGSTPVSAEKDGSLVAVSSLGSYQLRPGLPAGEPKPFDPPVGYSGQPRIAGYLPAGGGQVLTLWSSPSPGGAPLLVVYGQTSQGFVPAFRAELRSTAGGQPFDAMWKPSPSGDWGTLGRYLVDVYRGEVRDLGDVVVVEMANDRARAVHITSESPTTPDQRSESLLVAPAMPTGRMQDGEPLPEAVIKEGAFVRNGRESTVSLLPLQ